MLGEQRNLILTFALFAFSLCPGSGSPCLIVLYSEFSESVPDVCEAVQRGLWGLSHRYHGGGQYEQPLGVKNSSHGGRKLNPK